MSSIPPIQGTYQASYQTSKRNEERKLKKKEDKKLTCPPQTQKIKT